MMGQITWSIDIKLQKWMDGFGVSEVLEEKKTLLAFTKEVFTVKLKCVFVVNYGTNIFIWVDLFNYFITNG